MTQEIPKVIDAGKATLTLKTICGCLIVMIPILVYGTRQYDMFLSTQGETNRRLAEVADGLLALNSKVSTMNGQLDEHEHQLDRIQNSLDMAKAVQSKESTREKKYEDSKEN